MARYSVGQLLHLLKDLRSAKDQPDGLYAVIRVMPGEGRETSYRIKHESEAFERVVSESQLTEPQRSHHEPVQIGFKPQVRHSVRTQ